LPIRKIIDKRINTPKRSANGARQNRAAAYAVKPQNPLQRRRAVKTLYSLVMQPDATPLALGRKDSSKLSLGQRCVVSPNLPALKAAGLHPISHPSRVMRERLTMALS
jgi:hypothetical protein